MKITYCSCFVAGGRGGGSSRLGFPLVFMNTIIPETILQRREAYQRDFGTQSQLLNRALSNSRTNVYHLQPAASDEGKRKSLHVPSSITPRRFNSQVRCFHVAVSSHFGGSGCCFYDHFKSSLIRSASEKKISGEIRIPSQWAADDAKEPAREYGTREGATSCDD